MYEMSQKQTPEERFHSAQVMLQQWLSNYAKNHEPKIHTSKVFATKLAIDIRKHELVLQKIHEIMETIYSNLKGKQIYRTIQQNLVEASKHYLTCMKQPLTEKSLRNFHTSLENLFQLISPIHQEQIQYQVENEIKINFITHYPPLKITTP